MDILWMIGGFALILTPIIFIHELGHFLVPASSIYTSKNSASAFRRGR
jgi:hypothetical protein